MGIPRVARVPGGDLPASCGLGGNWGDGGGGEGGERARVTTSWGEG